MAKGSEDMILIESNLYKTKNDNSNLLICIIFVREESKDYRHYRSPFLIECSKEGGCSMAKQEVQLTFTFVNPNTPKEFERQLQKILIDKLLSQYWENRVAVS